MSWFSLGVNGKEVIDQYASVTGYFTGGFISNYICNNMVKTNALNLLIRETATNQIASIASPRLEMATKEISKKILEATFNEKKLIYITYKLKDQFLSSPKGYMVNMTKFALYLAKELRRKKQNTSNQTGLNPIDLQLAVAIFKKTMKGEITEAMQSGVLHSLTPMCEEAVQKALVAATKSASEKVYDFAVRKACSIVVLPFVYGVARTALQALGSYYQIEASSVINYLPNTSTILGVSIAGHGIQMARIIWKEINKSSDKEDLDKDEVKKIATQFAKEKMSKKVSENKLLSYLGVNKAQEDIEKLIESMVSEALDFYWRDLHETKVLGLPLVA